MPLILAIEPDRHQATQLHAMVRGRLRAELVLADSAERALDALGDRVPDLVLTSAFLSPKDETVLADRLRALDAAAAHVQTLTIPVLGAPRPRAHAGRGVLSVLLGDRAQAAAAPDGCDPAVFAEQCAAYLERAAHDREQHIVVMNEPVAEPPAIVRDAVLEEAMYDAVRNDTAIEVVPDEPTHEDVPVESPYEAVSVGPELEPEPEPEAEPEIVPIDRHRHEAFELDLSALLDESVVHELSAAIEHVTAAETERWVQPRPKKRAENWTAVPIGNRMQWPRMDGSCAEASGPRPVPQKASNSKIRPIASKRPPKAKPVQDDWGLFDPAQCGFAALLAKFDEIAAVAPTLPVDSASAGSPDVSR